MPSSQVVLTSSQVVLPRKFHEWRSLVGYSPRGHRVGHDWATSPLPSGLAKEKKTGLPWRLSGKEPACQYKRHGFDPWSEEILRAMEQLTPCTATTAPLLQSLGAATTEPTCRNYWSPHTREPVLWNKGSPLQREAHVPWREMSPLRRN